MRIQEGMLYKKEATIEIKEVLTESVRVHNEGAPEDAWTISLTTFNETYSEVVHDIGWAKNQLQKGKRVQRSGWNGARMWLKLINPGTYYASHAEVRNLSQSPFIAIATAQGEFVPWLCSQTDFLATDYVLVDIGSDE